MTKPARKKLVAIMATCTFAFSGVAAADAAVPPAAPETVAAPVAAVPAQQTLSAQETVRQASDGMSAALRADAAKLQGNPNHIYVLLKQHVMPHLDLQVMARLALGRHWRTATPEQKNVFVEQFSKSLVRTYAAAVRTFSSDQVQYVSTVQNEPGLATARTKVKMQNSAPLAIDYNLRLKKGTWKVYDISVEGVSIVTTLRGVYADAIQKRGLAGLINQMKAENAGVPSLTRAPVHAETQFVMKR